MNNATGSVWVVITNLGVVRSQPDRVQSETRLAFVAQTPELLIHDLDGNLVRDGRWMYSWDAENRLTRVMSVAGPSSSFRRVEWKYDAMGRRVRQTAYILTNGVWQVVEDLKLISDPELFGRHVAELNATNNSLVRAYVWGLDLSETLDGAGGVGGLLWVRVNTGPATGTHFVCYDGNGNVWQLVSASSGTETARCAYGPFGEPLRLSGSAALSNSFRFSTKRTEELTGLVLYESRAYYPTTGRWLSRDPIGESGGLNICSFLGGDPIRRIDPWGLDYSGGTGADFQEKLACLCKCGKGACEKAASLASHALSETRKRFPGSSAHNDKADAWRHCYWSCEMARQLGVASAKCVGDVHESANERRGQPPVERAMDKHNNSVGRDLAAANGDCADLCAEALADGKLEVPR